MWKGEDTQWVNVDVQNSDPSVDDWVGIFSPGTFDSSTCPPVDDPKEQAPYICSAPIKMTVTWTSGYDINEAVPLVEWGLKGEMQMRSPAGTLTFNRNSMCGGPARTVGWRDPGFIHTSFLKNLWPNSVISQVHIQDGPSFIQ